jgi:ornithine carbamoyltransferase
VTLRHFLEVDDLSPEELIDVLDRSETPQPQVLSGRGVGMIFEKPSLRTRNSTEMAVVQLGGYPVYIQKDEITLDVRERTEDAIRVLQGYYDIICARVFDHSQLERMAAVADVPVVNLLSNTGHPVQALADLLTIRQTFGSVAGLKMTWVGDFSNVALSLGIGLALLGASSTFTCPSGYGPTEEQLDRMRGAAMGKAVILTDPVPASAVVGAHIVSTDAWYSMGQESEKEIRKRAFEGFRVDLSMMRAALPNAIFLHCLPAHRGEEVTDEVMDSAQSKVFPQAHNRMHTMRGLFAWFDSVGSLRQRASLLGSPSAGVRP